MKEFENLENNLSKILIDNNASHVYEDGAFGNYSDCTKDKTKTFCFTKDKEKLTVFSRLKLGNNITFILNNGENKTISTNTCPGFSKPYINKKAGFRLCYSQFAKLKNKKSSINGSLEIINNSGSIEDYLDELSGTISNIRNINNIEHTSGIEFDYKEGNSTTHQFLFSKPNINILIKGTLSTGPSIGETNDMGLFYLREKVVIMNRQFKIWTKKAL